MLGQRTRFYAFTGLSLTSVNVYLCLLTLASIIHAGEAVTGRIVYLPYSSRLVNVSETSSSVGGRLEVHYNRTWGTVCDDNVNEVTANTLCSMLGYRRGIAVGRAGYGQGTGVIWLDEMACSGHETSISQCSHLPWGVHNCGHHEDLGLFCSNLTTVHQLYSIKLVNASETPSSIGGRLEVYYNGTWGTVCDDYANVVTANTLCRILGYRNGNPVFSAGYGSGTGLIWLDDVRCSGYETSISQCYHRPWGVHNCRHHEDLGLICVKGRTVPGSIRLVNVTETSSSFAGRLEVYYNSTWGTVCDDYANVVTANTLCRILGYRSGNPVFRAGYGAGTGVIWLDDVRCSGHETSISQCSRLPWGVHNCGHHEDLGLICSKVTAVSSIRLLNGTQGNYSLSGRLEVYYNDTWGTVCDHSFSHNSARVACNLLGFSQGVDLPNAYFGQGAGPILLDDVGCVGNETDLSECSTGGWGTHNCTQHEDVGLVCFNPNPQERLLTRLVDGRLGSDYLTGRLEVFNAGQWGTVCGVGFGFLTAPVICQSLGYEYGSSVPHGQFGSGSGPIWMDNVQCLGNETNISQCLRGDWRSSSCHHGEDMGLYCYNTTFSGSVQTRLAGGDNGTGWKTGRLEVYFAEQWGTVCSSQFNSAAATVVCRSVGFRSGNYIYHSYPWAETGVIWLGGAMCQGNETNIAECEHGGWGNHSCSHYGDVHVICSNEQPASNPCLVPSYEPCGNPSEGCFNTSHRCDGRYNCRNGFDESGC